MAMQPSIAPRGLRATLVAAALFVPLAGVGFTSPQNIQPRPNLGPGETNQRPQTGEPGVSITTQDLTTPLVPTGLARALVGEDVIVSNVVFNGADVAAGKFQGGTGIIGFEEGIILSSGNISSVEGPLNQLDDVSTNNGFPGDADLAALVPGFTLYDATVLEFDFECETLQEVSFQFVFSSDEYNEYVFSPFNDVFAFFLNGNNIALVPGAGVPVAIDNVNCGDPYDPPLGGNNCSQFINNDCSDLGGFPCSAVSTEMDGLTLVFTATGSLNPGVNHIKLAIADAGDEVYDSNVLIRGESFDCGALTGPVFDPPTPCGETLTASVGTPLTYDVVALATNGLGDAAVVLDATGVPAGATHTPALPLGPVQTAVTTFQWTPTNADIGTHVVTYTVVDQLGASDVCTVTIEVAECFLVIGMGTEPWNGALFDMGGHVFQTQLGTVAAWYPVSTTELVHLPIPSSNSNGPQVASYTFTAQVLMYNPEVFPTNPDQWSKPLLVRVGPDGNVASRAQGHSNGIFMVAETTQDAQGQHWLRFPFSIAGQ